MLTFMVMAGRSAASALPARASSVAEYFIVKDWLIGIEID
jgi:hypothetical protein